MQSTKANNKISSARIPGAQKKKPAAAVSPSTSPEVEKSSVAPSEVEAKEASKKVSPPAPLALEGWGLASYSSSDDEGDKPKPAATKKGKTGAKPAAKGRVPSKDRYLTPAGKNKQPAAQQDDDKPKPKPKPEPEEFMPGGAAAGLGELLTSFDPFADAELGGDDEAAASAPRGDVVHLRMQQRSGRKSLTTVQGLSAAYNYAKILRDLKRELHCSGIVVEDEELGSVIQLQGDHRKAVGAFLVRAGMVTKPNLKIHGF